MSKPTRLDHYSSFIDRYNLLQLPERLQFNVPLRGFTTWRVGGPADVFIEVKHMDSMTRIVALAREFGIPFFILGGGSNVLIGDKGFRGIVIRNGIAEYEILGDAHGTVEQQKMHSLYSDVWEDHVIDEARHVQVHYSLYSDFGDPSFHADSVFVKLSAGYPMTAFIRAMLTLGITGLEKFSRIPGTFGGWIYNNTHGHTLFIGDFIHEVRSITQDGDVITRSWKDLEFAYDYSYFHSHNEVILDGVIRLFRGNATLAQEISLDVIKNKIAHQPHNSGGCVFKNISENDRKAHGFETDAAGYIIDKKLGLRGSVHIGGAHISEKHGNFIETNDSATAADILGVIERVRSMCKEKYGIELEDEVFRVGEF